jgi:hypothetical protein
MVTTNTVHLLPPANGPPTSSLAEPDTDVEGMKMDKQFVDMFETNIGHCGAPTKLNSNHAQVEISYQLKDILHALCILDWQSEPHQQQPNPAEHWSADDSKTHNLHLNPLSDDVFSSIIRSHPDSLHHGESKMPTTDPQALVGHLFLLPQQEDGQCFLARIVKALDDYESDLECISFLCSAKDGEFEEILSYSGLIDSLESLENGEENVWKFHRIMGHQGPLLHNDEDYNGSLYSVMIEPLSIIAKDAIYGSEFVAVHTCVDQIIDLSTTLHYLGVPV